MACHNLLWLHTICNIYFAIQDADPKAVLITVNDVVGLQDAL